MTVVAAFNPKRGNNLNTTPGAGSLFTSNGIAGSKAIRFVNSGAGLCYVRIGLGAQIATINDTPILPNSSVILWKNQDDDSVAYISAAGTTLHIQPGEGITT